MVGKQWTPAEDAKLQRLALAHPGDWLQIASEFKEGAGTQVRSHKACQKRMQEIRKFEEWKRRELANKRAGSPTTNRKRRAAAIESSSDDSEIVIVEPREKASPTHQSKERLIAELAEVKRKNRLLRQEARERDRAQLQDLKRDKEILFEERKQYLGIMSDLARGTAGHVKKEEIDEEAEKKKLAEKGDDARVQADNVDPVVDPVAAALNANRAQRSRENSIVLPPPLEIGATANDPVKGEP